MSGWFSLRPPPHRGLHEKFQPVIVGELGSGMTRRDLGSLYIKVSLKLEVPLLGCYFKDSVKVSGPRESKVELCHGVLRHAQRLGALFFEPPPILKTFFKISTWESMPLSAGVLTLYCYGFLFAFAWQLPILIAGGACLSVWYTPPVNMLHVAIWNDEIVDTRTTTQKIHNAHKVLRSVQRVLDILATALEKFKNLFDWSDRMITSLFLCAMITAAVLLSWIIFIGEVLLGYIGFTGSTFQALIFPIGLIFFVPLHYFDQPKREKQSASLQYLAYLSNVWGRVPDSLENAHRGSACEQATLKPWEDT